MIEVLEELDAASNLLRAALHRYLSACSALNGCRTKIHATNRPPELSHRVTEELSLISSYETRIKEARAAISLSRNSCMDIVPINSLPNEILGQISRLIHNAQPCATDDRLPSISLMINDIDNCSIVCSRWRQVSASLGTLWSHIDLSLTQLSGVSERYLDRALGYAARASDTPLDVYIVDNRETHDPSTPLLARTYQFLSLIAPRIRSLTLYLDGNSFIPYQSHTILRTCFSNCTPGVLTRLVLNSQVSGCFLEAAENPQPFGIQSTEIPCISKQALEDLWLHITVLQSHGFYLPWASKAYLGLTELRLAGYDVPISERQVIDILKSSPQLRVIRFGLKITDSLPTDDPIVPVYLEDLEVLVWESIRPDSSQLRTFLRLIAPGLNPLQVSLAEVCQTTALLGEMREFFARSNVTKFRMELRPGYTPTLLDTLPPLEILSLRSTMDYLSEAYTNELDPHFTHSPSFQTLHVRFRDYTPHANEIKRIIERHSVQTFKLDFDAFRDSDVNAAMEHINELRTICPSVELFDAGNPSPFADWNEPLA